MNRALRRDGVDGIAAPAAWRYRCWVMGISALVGITSTVVALFAVALPFYQLIG